MSKKREMKSISSWLGVTLDWCRRTARRSLCRTRRVTFSTVDDHTNEQFEVGSLTKVKDGLQVHFRGNRMEFDEFSQSLSIGDRIRVLCDDGVLIAEKISPTQFELIHSQGISPFIH